MHIISNVWHYRVHEMIISSSQLFLCKPRGRVRLNEPINAEYSRLSSYWQIIFLKKWALLKLHCWPETLPCEGLALQVNRMLYLTSSACWTKRGSLLASVHKKANSSHSRSACVPEDDLCPFYVWVWLTSMLVVFLQQQQQQQTLFLSICCRPSWQSIRVLSRQLLTAECQSNSEIWL